jgi:hypothetical protein
MTRSKYLVLMRTKLWLEKRDIRWEQRVKWNAAQNKLFGNMGMGNENDAYCIAKYDCTLIEEDQWFIKVIGYVYILDQSRLRSALKIAGETDLHAKTYLAYYDRDHTVLKECANQGDALAQCQYARRSIECTDEEKMQLLTASMNAGYNEAFYWLSTMYEDRRQIAKAEEYLVKAIQLGSLNAIAAYSRSWGLKTFERIYWRGQEWLEKWTDPSVNFVSAIVNWHLNSVNAQEGFVYGHIVSLVDPRTIKNFEKNKEACKILPAILAAQKVHQTMVNNTKVAIQSWSLVGLRYSVVKDIRLLTAKMVWASRDQPEWYPKWQSPVFE